jgi:outer membrane protein assembly factor BamE
MPQLFPFFRAAALILATLFFVSGCAVYKMDINQGNYLTQDMVARLKVGQTKQQVRAILGTPLISDSFHQDRWDYVYSLEERGWHQVTRSFVAFFDGDKLIRWEGDKMPVSEIEKNRIAQSQALAEKEAKEKAAQEKAEKTATETQE